jgi:hypothetical protein
MAKLAGVHSSSRFWSLDNYDEKIPSKQGTIF